MERITGIVFTDMGLLEHDYLFPRGTFYKICDWKIIYTGGTFDLFHAGHVNFLKQCKKIGDQVVVYSNTDEFIFDYKGKSPIINYEQRKEVLLSCRYVDDVIPNVGGQDSKPTIEMVQPDFIVIGSD